MTQPRRENIALLFLAVVILALFLVGAITPGGGTSGGASTIDEAFDNSSDGAFGPVVAAKPLTLESDVSGTETWKMYWNPTAGAFTSVTSTAGGAKFSTGLRGTIVGTDQTDAVITMTADDCHGQWHFNTDADAIQYDLPPAAAGLSCCFANHLVAEVISINPNDGVDDILLDGGSIGPGDELDTSGSVADFVCLHAHDATYWRVLGTNGGLLDGGAS